MSQTSKILIVDDEANARAALSEILREEGYETETAADGTFAFHAADDAILEAVRGGARGWARLDNAAQLTHADQRADGDQRGEQQNRRQPAGHHFGRGESCVWQ